MARAESDWAALRQLHRNIEADRIALQLKHAVWSLAYGQLFFASFAFGSSRGPRPLNPRELILGICVTTLAAALWSLLRRGARSERGARWVGQLRAGQLRRRVVVFDSYLCVGKQVLPAAAIQGLEQGTHRLTLHYDDLRAEQTVSLELQGPQAALDQLEIALSELGPVGS